MNETSSDNSITPRPRRTQSLHQRVVTQVRKLSKSGRSKPNTMPSSARPAAESPHDLRPPRPETRRSQDSHHSHGHLPSHISSSGRSNTLSTGTSCAPSIVTSDTTLQSPTSRSFYSLSHHPTASLHLSLSAYPSNDRLHADAAGTLWVAVEVAGSVNVDDNPNSSQPMSSSGPSLAVGIVIDNS
jgi:hypothetical protein